MSSIGYLVVLMILYVAHAFHLLSSIGYLAVLMILYVAHVLF